MVLPTDVDYGPLEELIGVWTGDKGFDVSPEPDGSEENPYYETILFEGIGGVTNAESQDLTAVRYHQVVTRKSDDQVFHNETGYWMWDAKAGIVMHSLTIPRSVCVLAGGSYAKPSGSAASVTLEVAAKLGDPDWGILQSPFMRDNARTTEFRHTITISGDALSYSETTFLEIYGKSFQHTDKNELLRKPVKGA